MQKVFRVMMSSLSTRYGPLARNVKLRVAHAPVMRRQRIQRKPLVSDPGTHHGTWVTHVPWCTPGLLTRGGGENVPDIPGACAIHNFTYLVRGPWWLMRHRIAQQKEACCLPMGNHTIITIFSISMYMFLLCLPWLYHRSFGIQKYICPYSMVSSRWWIFLCHNDTTKINGPWSQHLETLSSPIFATATVTGIKARCNTNPAYKPSTISMNKNYVYVARCINYRITTTH